jgi:hypothetical protein
MCSLGTTEPARKEVARQIQVAPRCCHPADNGPVRKQVGVAGIWSQTGKLTIQSMWRTHVCTLGSPGFVSQGTKASE